MSTLICNGTGNLTGAATFAAAEAGANALALVRNSTTTFAAAASSTSSTFTVTNGKVIDAVLLWLFAAAGATGTIKVDLQKGGVSQASVTVNKADLPDANNAIPCPVVFKLGSTATGDGGSNWTIVVTTTGTGTVTYYRATSTTANFTRALRTTTAATAATGDDLYIVGELTGAGTHTSRTVTMDSTTATAYGNGSVNSTTVSGGLIAVSCYGTLTYGNSASTNYILRVAGDLIVSQYGTLNIGSSGAEIPRNSTAVLEFQPVSANGDFGLIVYNNGVWNAAGLSRTSGKNVVKCLLTADVASSNVATGQVNTGISTTNATGLDPSGNSLISTNLVETTANSAHSFGYGNGSGVTNTTQTATAWIARGTGVNNRFVRFMVGNTGVSSSVTNGFYSDIDLQAGTAGTVTAIGNGTATSVSITALGNGYLIKMTGKVSTSSSSQYVHICCCAVAGTISYVGSGASTVVVDRISLVTAASISDTTFNVDTDTGWLNGDAICIASTTRTAAECEIYPLNANAGSSSMTSALYPFGGSQTSTHHGTTPVQAEIGLLTRNVKIRSTSQSLWSYVYCEPLATINVSWVEFYYLGASISNKRGIENKDAATTNSKNFTFCSMHDCYGAFYGNTSNLSSFNVTFSHNIVWHTTGPSAITIGNGSGTGPDWTLDSNLIIGVNNRGMLLYSLAGICTNNTVAGAVSDGFYVNESGVIGTFDNNTSHSNGSGGFGVNSDLAGLVNNLTCWRNSSGVFHNNAGHTIDLVFNNLTLFGNGTYNFSFAVNSDGLTITGVNTFAGDTSFPTPYGVYIGNGNLALVDLSNIDMSGIGSIFAPHTTNDLRLGPGAFQTIIGTINNCKFGSPTPPIATAQKAVWSSGSYLSFQRYNQTAGDHRTEMTYGQLKTDNVVYHTASPSMRMTPSDASNKLESAPKDKGVLVAVASGATVSISVFVNKDATYNGNQPRLIQRANPALGQNSDVVLATYSSGTGSWNQLTATSSTSTDDGAWEFVVDCDGTTGFINIDDWSVS